MAKGSRGGQGSRGSISQAHTGVTVASGGQFGGSGNFTAFDDDDASDFVKANADEYDDPDFNYARKLYVSDAVDRNGYSFSQNLNYKLDNNLPLNANEQFMRDMLGNGIRPIGKDTVLYRAAHDDVLKAMGVKDYTKLSNQQLQQLVGTELQTTSYMSTSYDVSKNPFISGSQAGGREVQMEIRAASSTRVFLGAKNQAEVVTDVGTKLKLVQIGYDTDRNGRQKYATPRTKSKSMPVVRLVFEAI